MSCYSIYLAQHQIIDISDARLQQETLKSHRQLGEAANSADSIRPGDKIWPALEDTLFAP